MFWLKKVNTSWTPVGGNRGAYFLQREIMCALAQRKRTCCSSCISSASHRSQVGELLWFHFAVSKHRVWRRSLKQAVPRGKLRNMYMGRRMSDQSPFGTTFLVGRASTPLVIIRAFAVVFSRMSFRMRCSVLQVSLPARGLRQNGWDQWVHSSAASV